MNAPGRCFLLLALTALLVAPPGQADDTDTAPLVAAGKQLYREGRTATGTPLQAAIRSDVPMQGDDLACVRCHRRSGLGSSEGGVGIPPIAGATLFMAQTSNLIRDYRHGELSNIARPAYTLESLATALRDGVNPAGRTLSPLMPRYQISDAEVAAIAAYLPTLSTTAPGITEHELHFATIIAPDATPAQRQAMLAVMEAYIAGKNAGTRGETRRAERAPFHREWMYSAYRKWVLHEWHLSGPPEQWQEQLQRHYRTQPVFAVVGGVGTGTWQPVHAFCEEQELPCLFPHLNAAPDHAERDFYSFYFSRGVQLEAATLATHLQRTGLTTARVVQVARASSDQLAAVTALRESMSDAVVTHIIDHDIRADAAYWQDLLQQTQPDILVLWLRADDLEGLLAGAVPALPDALYLSSTLLPEPGALAIVPAPHPLHLLHPFQLPGNEPRQARFRIWARQTGVALQDLRLQSDAYFAVTLAGEALMHIRGNLSREYFIERIEHMTDSMLYTSSYPRLSLAPGQRYAAKGAYVWRLDEDAANAAWIVP